MAKLMLLLIIFFQIFGLSFGAYDYLALVVLWPKGVCINKNCKVQPKPNFFSIHGLWPSTFSKNQPRDCISNHPFPPNGPNIHKKWNATLVKNMDQYWISLLESNYSLWNKEWKHHGRCAEDQHNIQLTAEQYFSKTIEAYFKYKVQDVVNRLAQQKVSVTPGKEYSFTTLRDAFKGAFDGTDVFLKCNLIKDSKTKTIKEQHLREVLVYMDNKLEKFTLNQQYKITECDDKMPVIFTGK